MARGPAAETFDALSSRPVRDAGSPQTASRLAKREHACLLLHIDRCVNWHGVWSANAAGNADTPLNHTNVS